jgi:hypothetical protein
MRTLFVTVLLGLGICLHTSAQIVAVDPNYDPGSGSQYPFNPDGRTYGWRFTVDESPISVTQLGFFDAAQNGLADSHRVGIWDSTGNLIVDTIIPAGTSASLDGNFRFVSVTPTTLNANSTYSIGTLFPSGSDLAIAAASVAPTYAGEITYLGGTYSDVGTFNPPVNNYGSHGVFGPNFEFTAVPEPHHYALATGFGLAIFIGIRKTVAKRASRTAL